MTGKLFAYVLIMTLITVLVWVGIEVLVSRPKPEISPELQQALEPINPNFDQKLIDEL